MTALVMLLAGLAQANGLTTDSMEVDESRDDDASPGMPGDESPEGLIVNGFDSDPDDFPAVVALGYAFAGFNESFCSGTLINETWVLTAAHCIDTNLNGERVYVGVDVSDYEQRVRIERWIKHPSYNAQQITNDVGLVELEEPITSIAPMPLNDAPVNQQWMDREHYFVGYGITNDNRNDSGLQRWTTIPVVDFDNQVIYSYNGTFGGFGQPNYDGTTNICSGDSGGAAIQGEPGNYSLVGVNSYTVGNCSSGYSGVMRVDVHLDWIETYTSFLLAGDEWVEEPDVEPEVFNPDPVLSDEGGWGAPATPSSRSEYTLKVGACATLGVPASWSWLGAMALSGVLLARRRRD